MEKAEMTAWASCTDCGVDKEQQENVWNVTGRIPTLAQDHSDLLLIASQVDRLTDSQMECSRFRVIFDFSCKLACSVSLQRAKKCALRPWGILRTCFHSFIAQNFPMNSIWSQLYLPFIFDAELMLQLTACDTDGRVGSESPELRWVALSLIYSFHWGSQTDTPPARWEPPGVPQGHSVVLGGGQFSGTWEYIHILLSHNLKHLCKKRNLTFACPWCIKYPTLRVCC